jgi:DMSO/TMAO reductase YedYZ molybdopterin-dependent catalytic subunit
MALPGKSMSLSMVSPSGGMIVREKQPVNLEMPFGSLDSFITPVERFYVRCHHPIPEIDAETWRLKIEGDVENSLELS